MAIVRAVAKYVAGRGRTAPAERRRSAKHVLMLLTLRARAALRRAQSVLPQWVPVPRAHACAQCARGPRCRPDGARTHTGQTSTAGLVSTGSRFVQWRLRKEGSRTEALSAA
jgi:hypothetical protein